MDFLASRGSRRKGRREVQEAFYFFSSLVTLGSFLARMSSRVLPQHLRYVYFMLRGCLKVTQGVPYHTTEKC